MLYLGTVKAHDVSSPQWVKWVCVCFYVQVTPRPRTVLGGGGGGGGGYWGANSRPVSPGGGDGSDISSVMPQQNHRPKSRAEQSTSAKYNNLNYWRARKVSISLYLMLCTVNNDDLTPPIPYPDFQVFQFTFLQQKNTTKMLSQWSGNITY